jgi:hypothetical protein
MLNDKFKKKNSRKKKVNNRIRTSFEKKLYKG